MRKQASKKAASLVLDLERKANTEGAVGTINSDYLPIPDIDCCRTDTYQARQDLLGYIAELESLLNKVRS